MYMNDGLHLSRKGAAVFADELSAAVDSGTGSITNMFGSKLETQGDYLEAPQAEEVATSTDKPITKCPENISETDYKCVSLNKRSIVNKKNELNIMVEEPDPHIIGITESWANIDIKDVELGLTCRIGRREGEVILCIKESIQAYEIQLEREVDCN